MDSERLCRTLREMLPIGVCVEAGQALATTLTARERASLGTADPKRIVEFESGRAYAKRALAVLGMHDVELPIGARRSPVWPTGVVGSITHVQNGPNCSYVAAAVARTDVVLAVGIDFEMELSLDPHLWVHILTQRELERVIALPVGSRRAEAQYIWCAKEATTKIVKEPFDPSELEVERDPTSGEFIAKFADTDRKGLRSDFLGRTACLDGLFIATAAVPRELSLRSPDA